MYNHIRMHHTYSQLASKKANLKGIAIKCLSEQFERSTASYILCSWFPVDSKNIFGTYSIAEISWGNHSRAEIKACVIPIIFSLNRNISTIMLIIKQHHITIVYYLSISSPTSKYYEDFTITSLISKVTTLRSCARARPKSIHQPKNILTRFRFRFLHTPLAFGLQLLLNLFGIIVCPISQPYPTRFQ